MPTVRSISADPADGRYWGGCKAPHLAGCNLSDLLEKPGEPALISGEYQNEGQINRCSVGKRTQRSYSDPLMERDFLTVIGGDGGTGEGGVNSRRDCHGTYAPSTRREPTFFGHQNSPRGILRTAYSNQSTEKRKGALCTQMVQQASLTPSPVVQRSA